MAPRRGSLIGRVQSLTPAAAGAALLAPTTLPAVAHSRHAPAAVAEGGVTADDLLAETRGCAPVSNGRYRSDDGARADIPVCGKRRAVFWKADLDIDCDARPAAGATGGPTRSSPPRRSTSSPTGGA